MDLSNKCKTGTIKMTSRIVDVLILAVFADGQIDKEEAHLLQKFFSEHPKFADVSRAYLKQAQVSLHSKLEAGVSLEKLIEELGNELNEDEKNSAFALAYEICASNFEIDYNELSFLKNMQKSWKLKRSIVNSVTLSATLRYN